jgi:hypothetical protein
LKNGPFIYEFSYFPYLSTYKRIFANLPFIETVRQCDTNEAIYLRAKGSIPRKGHDLVRFNGHIVGVGSEESTMSVFADITFFEVCMTLLTVGLVERFLLAYAPLEMVGPDGWLIKADIKE